MRVPRFPWKTASLVAGTIAMISWGSLAAQQPASSSAPAASAASATPNMPAPKHWTAQEDHQNMMDQLGIRKLRPGPSGNEQDPNHANYDESKANPFPNLPDPLTLKNGQKVTTPEMWWHERRPEIVEDFEREVYGRVPAQVPVVTWRVARTQYGVVAGHPVLGRELVGHVDNSAYPAIDVNISLMLVTPADVHAPVPVMIMFRGGGLPGDPPPARGGFGFPAGRGGAAGAARGRAAGPGRGPAAGPARGPSAAPARGGPGAPGAAAPQAPSDPPATDQLISGGWGYALLNPTSVQADNGAGLTAGIIGLVNKGQPRKPDDWGSLRAWAWGAGRALDYLESDPSVDATKVGIDGVSRYGKAALVTMAFDPRFAMVLVGSSGEGGAKLNRRNWGEAVENLTGSGEYHWMAGNFLKYGASDATFGSKNAGDLPVDSHELIALCAPRLTFISYGVPEKGDAKWLDHQGSYMATVAAGKVFRLLGARDLGVGDDYHTAKMPPVNTSLLDGQLAWRQHDGGHTDGPNWKYFIPWADNLLGYTAPDTPGQPRTPGPADVAAPRTDANSKIAHEDLLRKRTEGRVDVYFEGDSIARRWGATDQPDFLANWRANFRGWNVGDFAWGADRTENILWRLQNGELDGLHPKVIVLLAGTNNVGGRPGGPEKVADVTRGVQAIVNTFRQKVPDATVILTAIFPRGSDPAVNAEINQINANLAAWADGKTVRFLNINDKLADKDGTLIDGMLNAQDHLHPTLKGYQVWADALKPMLTELLGPPAATDEAPPPTGDPSARGRAAN
jgi:lysophospholipase L1-like esterase